MAIVGGLVLFNRQITQMTLVGTILTCFDDRGNTESYTIGGIGMFICNQNYLLALPIFPDHLQELSCSENQLQSLPSLPKQLKVLSCFDNQLRSLPELPETLEKLSCHHNRLKILPRLPNALTSLQSRDEPMTKGTEYISELAIYRKKYQTYFYLITYLTLHLLVSPVILSNEAWWFPGII